MAYVAKVFIWRNANYVKKPNPSVIEISSKSSKVCCAQVSVSLFLEVFLFCL